MCFTGSTYVSSRSFSISSTYISYCNVKVHELGLDRSVIITDEHKVNEFIYYADFKSQQIKQQLKRIYNDFMSTNLPYRKYI